MKRDTWKDCISHLEQFYADNPEQIEANMRDYFQGLSTEQRSSLLPIAKLAGRTNCGFKMYRTAQAFIRLSESSTT